MPGGSVLVPDLLAVDAEPLWTNQSGILDATAVHLVVEIVSPGSVTMDRLAKPALYANAGISAFWRVELGRTLRSTHTGWRMALTHSRGRPVQANC